ncbi:MAG: GTPase domain-containing protein [Candidatus Heimdallarchaeota archaeon]
MNRVVISGLQNSGKSSIFREAYQNLAPSSHDEEDYYRGKILKAKSLEKLLKIEFDEVSGDHLGNLPKSQIKEYFRGAAALIWTVDVSDERTISTSLFYWDLLVKKMDSFPFLLKYVCFHKTDLVENMEQKQEFFGSLRQDFTSITLTPPVFYYTSLQDNSTHVLMARVLQNIQEKSIVFKQMEHKIKEFLLTNEDFFGAVVISNEGLAVIEAGEDVEYVTLPANLWLSTNDRLREAFNIQEGLACTIHLDEQTLIFFDLNPELLLCTISKKEAPLQFSFVRSDLLGQALCAILKEV